MNEEASVFQLITALCANIIKEVDENAEKLSLNAARSAAYQILLKNNHREILDREKILEELQFSSFELSLAGRNDDSKEVIQFIEDLKDKSSDIESICSLLVHLKNIDPDPENDKHQVIIIDQYFPPFKTKSSFTS